MTDNANAQLPSIQLLIAACPTAADAHTRYAWLHGYCLLSYRQVGPTVLVSGQVRIGQPYAENCNLVADLANALDPAACLAGLDLHDMISRLSGLPIGAKDQAPALALLGKLRAMLEDQRPIELGLDDDHTTELALKVLEHNLSFSESLDDDARRLEVGAPVHGSRDNGNPHRLAEQLADTASAAILALGELYLEDDLQPKLLAAWQAWRHGLSPSIGQPKSAFAIDSSN